MVHDSATMDHLIEMCSAATRSFAETIDVPGVPDWLLIRLQGHVNAMHTAPLCVIPACAALNDIEARRQQMQPHEKAIHRPLEILISDCIIWRV